MYVQRFGVILLISGLICKCNSDPFAYEENWKGTNLTARYAYRENLLESDSYARIICNIKQEDCHVCGQFPRFTGPNRTCPVIFSSTERSGKLPNHLSVINTTIIIPRVVEKFDHDVLTLHLINMDGSCNESNITRDVVTNSAYRIVTFSNYFDVFYDPAGPTKEEKAHNQRPGYLKESFDHRGKRIDGPIKFFALIPDYELFPVSPSGNPLLQLLAVSIKDGSRGYYFVSKSTRRVQFLKPSGEPSMSPIELDFSSLPDLASYGQGSLLVSMVDKFGNYTFQMVSYNREGSFRFTYNIEEGKELRETFSLPRGAILIVTCDNSKKDSITAPRTAQAKTCYMQTLYANSMITPPKEIAKFYITDATEIYLSWVIGQYCFNAVTYGGGQQLIESLQTGCVYDQSANDDMM